MNEKKLPDEEQTEGSFNEDFDFGEGETEKRPVQTDTKPGINKKLLGGIFIVIFTVILIMGYRVYSPSITTKSTHITAERKPTSPPATTQTPPMPTEQNFGEIAEAFSTADHSTSTAASTQKSNTSEGNLQQLQKELFAPEQSKRAMTGVPTETEASQLAQGLNKLNQQIDYILGQIKHLDSYSQEVSENLNKLNAAITLMDTRLSTLTNTTSNLSKDIGSVKQVLKEDGLDMNLGAISGRKREDEKNATISIEEPEYIVHAVIPGRAWLKSTRGQIITVAEGDAIGNYGKILVIDAANGVVLTSSGVAFR